MLNIDSSRNKNSLLPSYYLDKIVLEQNLGFIKGFDDPHISSDQETDNEQAESVPLSLTIESSYSIKKTGGRLKSPALKHLLGESLKTAIVFWQPTPEQMVDIDSGVYGISDYEEHFKDKLSDNNTAVFEQTDAIKEKQKIGFSTDEYEVFNFKNTKSYQSKPTNLVLLYASYIEMPEGYVPTNTSRTIFSDINIEIVLKNGKALTQSRVYRLSDTKEIWTGAIQTVGSDQELRTVEENPRPVEVSFVKNYKIQDNRIQKTIEKEILKFTDLNNQIADAKMAKLETERTPTRISNLFLSNSIDGKVTAFFSFDQLGLLADNALLFKRLDSSDSILRNKMDQSCVISNLKILRRRILKGGMGNNSLTTEYNSAKYDSRFGKEECLVQTKQAPNTTILEKIEPPYNQLKNTLKEIRTIIFNSSGRMISFTDLDIAKKTDGEYQYGVEIEFVDPSNLLIKDDLDELQKYIKQAVPEEQRRKIKAERTLERILPEIDNPHIQATEERVREVETLPETRVARNTMRNVLNNAVDGYAAILSKYYSIEDTILDNIKQTIKTQIDIDSDNPTGISNFIKLMQNLHSSIQNIISREIVGNTNPHIGEGVNQYNNDKKTFTLKHYFDNIYVSRKNEQTINIQYLPRNGFSRINTFAQCDVNQFEGFINELLESGRMFMNSNADMSILPASITKGEGIYDINNIKFEFTNRPVEYQKTIRQNILKHVNISVYRYAEPETSQPFQTEQGQYPSLVQPNIDTNFFEQQQTAFYENEKINEFYKYCSENFVQEKTFDEVVNLLLSSEEERQKLVTQLVYYRTFDGYKGAWEPIGNLSQDSTIRIEDGVNTYIPCTFMMSNNDMRNNGWTTKNMKIIDSLFFIKIGDDRHLEKLKSFVRRRSPQFLATTQRVFSFQGS